MSIVSEKNLVWIDCEMTGLNPYLPPSDLPAGETFLPDRILEVAVIVTDKHLTPLHAGFEIIVHTPKEVLERMNPWCIEQHGKTGLTASCLASTHTMEEVDEQVTTYIQQFFPPGFTKALLAGSSVHADRAFINKDLPLLAGILHYRILDVSTIKELSGRWYPSLPRNSNLVSDHRALSDIEASIQELRYYREHVFKPVEPAPSS